MVLRFGKRADVEVKPWEERVLLDLCIRFGLVTRKEWYRMYLRTEHWKAASSKKKLHDKMCQNCGEKARLEVHHKVYKYWEEQEEDLVTLCRECHGKIKVLEVTEEFEARKKMKILDAGAELFHAGVK